MKKVLLDASSAILLYKADMFDKLTTVYRVGLTQTVLRELTWENRQGSEVFRQYQRNHNIEVIATGKILHPDGMREQQLSLDPGELDTINCFLSGGWNFIITDDGSAAKYCSRNDIPFINALLFPRLLYLCHRSTLTESMDKMKTVASYGRYANHITAWARSCSSDALHFAIPDDFGKISCGDAQYARLKKHDCCYSEVNTNGRKIRKRIQ